jgi:hypothetical protein
MALMDARLTRDGLLRVELRLSARQCQALYARFDELRRVRGEPLSDQECLRVLLADCLAGAKALFGEDGEDREQTDAPANQQPGRRSAAAG